MKKRTKQRNEQVEKLFDKMSKKGLNTEEAIEAVGKHFCISNITVSTILKGGYEPKEPYEKRRYKKRSKPKQV